ncbi:hypothetical protein CG723_19500 [Streptomyces sp. CB01635]|uniref:hypothetical protein n=1 Tax=unclassified Streptomyces TaxID=2593676 RepID=UPI000C280942|nr:MULTISPECIES: hypothetical protein [unclassified Streptomyces]PJN09924.1 hypothetical protein CG723_19500 [Streptomyces sp. CB01635]WSE05529.1 hypothetical protein OG574_20460 [Streptomyces sp. NBC_01445]
MGYWGYYVVARSQRPLAELDALGGARDGLTLLERRADGWQVWECPDGGDRRHDVGSMNALATETGAPALFGYVMDSDCVVIEAAAPESGAWTTCLARDAMAGYLSADELTLEDYFLEPADAARRAVAWAQECGRTVEQGPLADVLGQDPDPFAEPLFFRFLDRLGVAPL